MTRVQLLTGSLSRISRPFELLRFLPPPFSRSFGPFRYTPSGRNKTGRRCLSSRWIFQSLEGTARRRAFDFFCASSSSRVEALIDIIKYDEGRGSLFARARLLVRVSSGRDIGGVHVGLGDGEDFRVHGCIYDGVRFIVWLNIEVPIDLYECITNSVIHLFFFGKEWM